MLGTANIRCEIRLTISRRYTECRTAYRRALTEVMGGGNAIGRPEDADRVLQSACTQPYQGKAAGGEGGIRTHEGSPLHAFQACALSH